MSGINTKLLRKIQKFILQEKGRFDMSDWLQPTKSSSVLGDEKALCGTACCLAGAAYVLEHKLDLKKPSSFDDLPSGHSVEIFATRALGLTANQRLRLFFRSEWPAKYATAYVRARSQAGRARAGVNRIEHFIKTKGAE